VVACCRAKLPHQGAGFEFSLKTEVMALIETFLSRVRRTMYMDRCKEVYAGSCHAFEKAFKGGAAIGFAAGPVSARQGPGAAGQPGAVDCAIVCDLSSGGLDAFTIGRDCVDFLCLFELKLLFKKPLNMACLQGTGAAKGVYEEVTYRDGDKANRDRFRSGTAR